MNLGKEQEAFSKNFEKLLNFIHSNGYSVRIGEVERSRDEQEIYIKTGKSKTYNSMHLNRLAADIFIFKGDEWLQSKQELAKFGEFWESLGSQNRWGGNFKTLVDCVHFERNA